MFEAIEPFVRRLEQRDIAAITAIYREHVLHGAATFEETPPPEAEMARRIKELRLAGFPCLVAERGDRVVGYAYAGPFHRRSAYRFTVEDSIYLHPDALRQGIGRALLRRLIEACRQAGYRQMMAVIGDSGNAGSIRLHEALGFRPVGTARAIGVKFGRQVDVVYMQLELRV